MLTFAGLKQNKRQTPYLRVMAANNGNEQKDPNQVLEKYREDVAHITAYANAIAPVTLFIYGQAPDWYNDDFKTKFVDAKAHAQLWINDISSRLISVPKTIVNYDVLYQSASEDILNYCKILLDEKSQKDKDAVKNALIESLNGLLDSVKKKRGLVYDVEKSIKEYAETIGEDTNFFVGVLKQARETLSADKELLEKYEDKEAELRAEIKHLEDVVLGTGIAGGIALAAAPIGFAFGPIGIVIGIITAVGALALLITAITESAICNAKRAELSAIVQKMSDVGHTVTSLEEFCKDLATVKTAAEQAVTAATAIKVLWEELEKEMNTLISNLQKGEEDALKESYNALVEEIDICNDEWNAIVEKAKLYSQLDIEVETEVIEIPQSA